MCDPAWTSEDLARVLCDNLVAAGKLRSQPAFIREDREAKIAGVFACGSPPVLPLSLALHPSHVSCVPGGEVSLRCTSLSSRCAFACAYACPGPLDCAAGAA
jgi:hypothetical protein|eukprot:SAG25_NODE_343_length_9443_cov_3.590218_3_plen_102_part_00